MDITACPRHQNTVPAAPPRPFTPGGGESRTYKCCGAGVGSEHERRGHHCPCCGDKLTGSCLNEPVTGAQASCGQCGDIDCATGTFIAPTDLVLDLLLHRLAPADNERVRQRATELFGGDVADTLAPNNDRARDHVGWTLAVARASMALRWYGDAEVFRAASPCPHPGCYRGQLWTLVGSRDDLIRVRREGPGRDHLPCGPCARAGRR